MSRWDSVAIVEDMVQSAMDKSGNFGVIEIEHRRIHQGEGFNASETLADNETLETGQKLYISNITANNQVHLKTRRIQFDKSKVRVNIYEDVEFVPDEQEEIDTYAMNRVNVKDSGMKIYNSNIIPDVSNATVIGENILQGLEEGSGNSLVGSPAADDNTLEYVYKPNTKYAIELENIGTPTIEFLSVYWYWYVAARR